MSTKLMIALALSVAAPALAAPGLKADGMWGHVGRAVKKKGEHVVRVKMLGSIQAVDRQFLALTAGPKGRRYIYGTVNMPTGKVSTQRVEKTE